eukprot:CAMPEP_0171102330 /NCGR_PEP_ID=MMETSP0766_2-20121228/57504_1 /TAXON_ID=439317 /ORGANISM="Gambierdiscus australes, Strain CAWD 149" /LENGTH=34 /DNA_ID= /DNA_START= /DNA_END= /DNA_ORIENTATION=
MKGSLLQRAREKCQLQRVCPQACKPGGVQVKSSA